MTVERHLNRRQHGNRPFGANGIHETIHDEAVTAPMAAHHPRRRDPFFTQGLKGLGLDHPPGEIKINFSVGQTDFGKTSLHRIMPDHGERDR